MHFAVLDLEQAAFLAQLPEEKTTLYAKSRQERLDIKSVVPRPDQDGDHAARIFFRGPSRMMQKCKQITNELDYPEYVLHFKDFGVLEVATLVNRSRLKLTKRKRRDRKSLRSLLTSRRSMFLPKRDLVSNGRASPVPVMPARWQFVKEKSITKAQLLLVKKRGRQYKAVLIAGRGCLRSRLIRVNIV